MWPFKKQEVRLVREFRLKYTMRMQQGSDITDSPMRDAIVIAESQDEAINKLEKTLKKEWYLTPMIYDH